MRSRELTICHDLFANENRAAAGRPLRIVLYSHGSVGLGHIRRNLLIAQTLACSPLKPTILVIAEAHQAGAFTLPPRTDCLTLPALRKEPTGERVPRSLDVSVEELIAMRARTIQATLEMFAPHALIVDNIPRGAMRELEPTLQQCRETGRTRCILGLRDVLDEPEVIRVEWGRAQNEAAIRDYYDAVWVYGDRNVYDMAAEYGFSDDVGARLHYTGYLDQSRREALAPDREDVCKALGLPSGPFVLCTVGGGQDGALLAEAFTQATLPPHLNGVLLTGPFMPPDVRQRLRRYADRQPRLCILEHVTEATLLTKRAERVVTMGGYNTTCEALSYAKRALLVPRVIPRREQMIRAERLRDLGLLDILHPDDVNPCTLTEWLRRDLAPLPDVRQRLDLDGLKRLPELLHDVLQSQTETETAAAPQTAAA